MRLSQFGPHQPRHRRRAWLVAAVVVAALLIAGATAVGLSLRPDGDAEAAPSASPSASPVPSRFDSPQALVTYLDSIGHTCSGYEAVQGATGAIARGRCYVGADEVTVGVYAVHSDVQAQWDLLAGTLQGISPVYMALGENWTVGGPEQWTKQVAVSMGATFRSQD
jgi:hypothetical protein